MIFAWRGKILKNCQLIGEGGCTTRRTCHAKINSKSEGDVMTTEHKIENIT